MGCGTCTCGRAALGGDWSDTAHRAVRLDGHPPQVTIALDPPCPADNGGWYNTPVTATVTASDPSSSAGQSGSGVASVEISADGVTWQPYADPVVYSVDMPLTALWACATDAVGHTSEPISVTFGLDLTAPSSEAVPGCWDAGGDLRSRGGDRHDGQPIPAPGRRPRRGVVRPQGHCHPDQRRKLGPSDWDRRRPVVLQFHQGTGRRLPHLRHRGRRSGRQRRGRAHLCLGRGLAGPEPT